MRYLSVLLLVVCSLLCGCSSQLPTYPVAGKIRFVEGGPVKVGTVELKSREHGVQARGHIETDGTFTLTTFAEGDGAVAGLLGEGRRRDDAGLRGGGGRGGRAGGG